ncbi:gliding motility-associated peptidyl-prolyl isomerase GldI [Mesonia maritima]|uniref:Peptidyl-prolyl cis-trans isomerase n=1 Tax=Mesonia maritima TaxID=1793873 RepID=A0ABU1K4W4_9FLAO|nr:gliding motility-associated peptidyl-prolyl isomerase GldI [Mesonia maritima]MDR6300295.1 gliding motility-associated peptidyl-prolyl isomerase [Mesonia maritima]
MKTKISILLLLVISMVACKTPEARKPVSHNSGSFINESIQRNKKLIKQEEDKILNIIHQDSTNNYLSSTNGFWYYYNTKVQTDSLLKPQFGDLVTFNYDIATLNGNSIYSKDEIGLREYVMDKENLFTGLRQALKLLKEGETATFLFPSHKAFGYYGDNDRIGRNTPIRSTITLNSIEKIENENQNNP